MKKTCILALILLTFVVGCSTAAPPEKQGASVSSLDKDVEDVKAVYAAYISNLYAQKENCRALAVEPSAFVGDHVYNHTAKHDENSGITNAKICGILVNYPGADDRMLGSDNIDVMKKENQMAVLSYLEEDKSAYIELRFEKKSEDWILMAYQFCAPGAGFFCE
jgi:hypothetical protein